MTAAALLMDRLEAEGRRVYIDPQDKAVLRVSGDISPELRAELVRHKPEILARLEAEALAREADRLGSPFAEEADPAANPAAPPWRLPDGSLMAHATREAFLWMGEFLRGLRSAGGTPAEKRARKRREGVGSSAG